MSLHCIQKRTTQHATQRGFTIIEAVVSIAIFTTVMVVGAGSLLSIMTANRKAQSIKSAMDNLNFAVDNMTRALRTGSEYWCNNDPVNRNCGVNADAGPSVSFREDPDVALRTMYYVTPVANGAVTCPATGGTIMRSRQGVPIDEAITSDEVHITSLKFYIYGANPSSGTPSDTQQPRAVVSVSGFAGISPKDCTTFHIHTSVTQRFFEQN